MNMFGKLYEVRFQKILTLYDSHEHCAELFITTHLFKEVSLVVWRLWKGNDTWQNMQNQQSAQETNILTLYIQKECLLYQLTSVACARISWCWICEMGCWLFCHVCMWFRAENRSCLQYWFPLCLETCMKNEKLGNHQVLLLFTCITYFLNNSSAFNSWQVKILLRNLFSFIYIYC